MRDLFLKVLVIVVCLQAAKITAFSDGPAHENGFNCPSIVVLCIYLVLFVALGNMPQLVINLQVACFQLFSLSLIA